MKKTKVNPAPRNSHSNLLQYPRGEHSRCGIKAEKRDEKKKLKMKVSGKSVFKIKEILVKKARNTGSK